MAMRMTGMYSGMDTESIIQELVSAKRTKVDDVKKKQTKLEWKQDAWKDLNTKLKNLQSKYISNMRFASSYMKKTTAVSNSSAVSVITGENAVNGVQSLEVKQLAKIGYLTGAQIKASGSGSLTALSKLSDLAGSDGIGDGGQISIKAGDKDLTLDVTADTTISDVLTKLKEAGLNANFDEKQQRLFISAKTSGASNDFSITAAGSNGQAALKALGIQLNPDGDPTAEGYAKKIDGQDAKIELNGATFTNNTNVFEINGLTFTALSETKAGEAVTITTQDDTDGIYDMIKGFLKEYNSIMNEMDKLYNAASASKYEPLTDDEKDAMSDTEVEKYEKKIKDSLLRRDSTLSTIRSKLTSVMSSGTTVDGKQMHLSDFGIDTLSYFTAAENEKNAYHIDGDPDDENTSGNADKLKSMIASDPDTVVSFFSSLHKELYSTMDGLSKAVEGYRSYGSFYDDKKMKSDYSDYTTKIAEMEKKLNAYEDKWYSKFSKMETALAPAELTLMLYEGAIKFCNIAIMAIEKKDIEKSHVNIVKVENIINYLQSTLDTKYPVSEDYDRIYTYLQQRLAQANIRKDPEILEEVCEHLRSVRDTWKEVMAKNQHKGAE